MNNQPLSPQGYNINNAPVNTNPFWDDGEGGGNVPPGGDPGQVLTKRTTADYDTEWTTPETGVEWPAGGIDGDLLVKAEAGAQWKTPDYATSQDLANVEQDAADASEAAADAAQAAADEKTRAEAAELVLRQAIDAETGRATTAENGLSGRINTVVNDLSDLGDDLRAEEARAESAEQNLQDAITAETERASAAERDLNVSITAAGGDISAEVNARINADSLLRDDIAQNAADISNLDARVGAAENNALPLIKQSTGEELPKVREDSIGGIGNQYQLLAFVTQIGSEIKTKLKFVIGRFTRISGTPSHVNCIPVYSSTNTNDGMGAVLVQQYRYGLWRHSRPAPGTLLVVGSQTQTTLPNEADITSPVNGGAAGQVLKKATGADYDWEWANAADPAELDGAIEDIDKINNGIAGEALVLEESLAKKIIAFPWVYYNEDGVMMASAAAAAYGSDATGLVIPPATLAAYNAAGSMDPTIFDKALTGTLVQYDTAGGNPYYFSVGPGRPVNAGYYFAIPDTAAYSGPADFMINFDLSGDAGNAGIAPLHCVSMVTLWPGETTVAPIYGYLDADRTPRKIGELSATRASQRLYTRPYIYNHAARGIIDDYFVDKTCTCFKMLNPTASIGHYRHN